MDIPSIRFLFPVLVLGAFYWGLILNPWIPGSGSQEYGEGLPPEAFETVLKSSARFLAEGDVERAEQTLLQVHEQFPENSTYMLELAQFYNKVGRYAEEARTWEQFMDFAPLPGMACPQVGIAYRNSGQPDLAAEKFKECFEIEETSDTTLFEALTLEQEGKLRESQELYDRVLEAAPHYPDAIIGAARVRIKLGKVKEAQDLLFQDIDQFSTNPDALLVAGMIKAQLGEIAAARDFYQRGQRLRPQDPDFRRQLARLGGSP